MYGGCGAWKWQYNSPRARYWVQAGIARFPLCEDAHYYGPNPSFTSAARCPQPIRQSARLRVFLHLELNLYIVPHHGAASNCRPRASGALLLLKLTPSVCRETRPGGGGVAQGLGGWLC